MTSPTMEETLPNTPLVDNTSDTHSDKTSTMQTHQPQPPDGGFWAWLVLVGCFLVNGIIFGIINTFGILFVQLKQDMEAAGVEDAATKCGKLKLSEKIHIMILIPPAIMREPYPPFLSLALFVLYFYLMKFLSTFTMFLFYSAAAGSKSKRVA